MLRSAFLLLLCVLSALAAPGSHYSAPPQQKMAALQRVRAMHARVLPPKPVKKEVKMDGYLVSTVPKRAVYRQYA